MRERVRVVKEKRKNNPRWMEETQEEARQPATREKEGGSKRGGNRGH